MNNIARFIKMNMLFGKYAIQTSILSSCIHIGYHGFPECRKSQQGNLMADNIAYIQSTSAHEIPYIYEQLIQIIYYHPTKKLYSLHHPHSRVVRTEKFSLDYHTYTTIVSLSREHTHNRQFLSCVHLMTTKRWGAL